MGSKFGYYVRDWDLEVDGLITKKNGDLKRYPIKLVSATFVSDNPACDISDSLADIYMQVLGGEKPEWVLRLIKIFSYGRRVIFEYDHPDEFKEKEGTFVEFDVEDIIELSFEVEHDNNDMPSKYWFYGSDSRHTCNPAVESDDRGHDVYGSALVECLKGGAVRRIYGLAKYEEGFRITEEGF